MARQYPEMNFEEAKNLITKELGLFCKKVSVKATYDKDGRRSAGGDLAYNLSYTLYTDRFCGKKEIKKYGGEMWIEKNDPETVEKVISSNIFTLQQSVLNPLANEASFKIQSGIKTDSRNTLEKGVLSTEFKKISR